MNKTHKVMDLKNSYLVLGSGPNALATILGLIEGGKKIYVVDAGLTNENAVISSNKSSKSSPKFLNPDKHYVYNNFDREFEIKKNNFKLTASLAKGGLSNIWGGGIQPFNSTDIDEYPYGIEDINFLYRKMYKLITDSDDMTDLNKEINDSKKVDIYNKKITFLKSLFASKKSACFDKACKLPSCKIGCVNCNKGIFNSATEIDKLVKQGKITYFPNRLIESIERLENGYVVNCRITDTKEYISYTSTNIFCSLGTISTTKIILEMQKDDKDLKLLTTPMARFFIFSLKKSNINSSSIIDALTFKIYNGDFVTGNIFPITRNLIETMLNKNISKYILKIFASFPIPYFYVGNIFFPSNFSSNSFGIKKGILEIQSYKSDELIKKYSSTIKQIKKEFKSEGYYVIPFTCKLLSPGEDIHYGGTLPMKENPKPYQCNNKGQLYGYDNFFITDSSSMPFLPAKPHTFNSMCQAFLISSKFANEIPEHHLFQ